MPKIPSSTEEVSSNFPLMFCKKNHDSKFGCYFWDSSKFPKVQWFPTEKVKQFPRHLGFNLQVVDPPEPAQKKCHHH